jgi:hypothetical protein
VIKAATIMSIQLRLMACILALASITVAQEPKTVSGYIQTAVAYQRAGKHPLCSSTTSCRTSIPAWRPTCYASFAGKVK